MALLIQTSFFLCLQILLPAFTSALTQPQLSAEETALRQAILNSRDGNGNFRLLAGAVRLAFHDCVGGCDGCINPDNPDNRGLGTFISQLDTLFSQRRVDRLMSRADYWALAGIVAVRIGGDLSGRGTTDLTFRTGRVDCPSSPSTNITRVFPDPNGNNTATLGFFRDNFGFDAQQTVAIIGAHTLGRAHRDRSGFDGPWVGRENHFDNEYYGDLSRTGWTQSNVSPPGSEPHFQWNRGRNHMMLQADMSLFKDVQPDARGFVSCTFSTCGSSPTASIVLQYARSNSLWLRDFSAVFQLLIQHGGAGLRDVGAEIDTTTEAPTRPTTQQTTQPPVRPQTTTPPPAPSTSSQASSSPNPSVADELKITEEGCFADATARDLSLHLVFEDNSPAKCARECWSKGFKVIGLQFGRACFCGNTFGRYGHSGLCSVPCPGDSSQRCGGGWANNVFTLSQTVTQLPPSSDTTQTTVTPSRPEVTTTAPSPTRPTTNASQPTRPTFNATVSTLRPTPNVTLSTLRPAPNVTVSTLRPAPNATVSTLRPTLPTRPNASLPTAQPTPPSSDLRLTYLGCYLDAPASDLEYLVPRNVTQLSNTPQLCAQLCHARGHPVLGLQWGDRCYCGSVYGRYGPSRLWPCFSPCPGDPRAKCGGPWTNSIYRIDESRSTFRAINTTSAHDNTGSTPRPSTTTPTITRSTTKDKTSPTTTASSSQPTSQDPTTRPTQSAGVSFEYRGCWYDTSIRDLQGQMTSLPGKLTPELCGNQCNDLGFSYFGLQFGRACLCGNSYGKYVRGSTGACSVPCEGDANATCGGVWHNSVYAIVR